MGKLRSKEKIAVIVVVLSIFLSIFMPVYKFFTDIQTGYYYVDMYDENEKFLGNYPAYVEYEEGFYWVEKILINDEVMHFDLLDFEFTRSDIKKQRLLSIIGYENSKDYYNQSFDVLITEETVESEDILNRLGSRD